MKKANYAPLSIRIPQWMDQAVREIAEKDRRSVTAQLEVLVAEELSRRGYTAPSGARADQQEAAV
jgi:hypothetical protein